jgi:hypothetical protein
VFIVNMRAPRIAPILATGFALLCGWAEISATGSAAEQYERVVSRFNKTAPPAYRAYRRLEAGSPDKNKTGWLEAWTEFRPGEPLKVEVVDEGGSEYVRNKVLRGMLFSEQELVANGKPLRAVIDANNYELADGGTTEDGLQRVTLKAARKSEGIVNGALFIEPETGYVTRIEGRLVKSPSFWVHDVDVTWKFARIGGHVLPVEVSSLGKVRMYGRSRFKMVYDYVSIDGHPTGARLNAALRDEP